jgi:hypothetical protein
MLSALAWPLAAVAIALLFRHDLSRALARLGQVRYHGVELTFRDELRQAEAMASNLVASVLPPPVIPQAADDATKNLVGTLLEPVALQPASRSEAERETLVTLARRSPRSAVLEGWSTLALAVARASSRGRLGALEADLVGRLRGMRDRVDKAEAPAPTAEEARRFVELAHRVSVQLDESV